MLIITSEQADAETVRRLERVNVSVERAGPGLSGHQVLEALGRHGLRVIYSIADTLVWGATLEPPPAFALQSLYLDSESLDGAGQLFAAYRRIESD